MSAQPSFNLPPLNVRRVVSATLLAAAIGAGFWLLWRFHDVVFMLFVAIVISTAMQPAVELLRRRGVPRRVGILLIFLVLLILLALLLTVVLPPFVQQAEHIVDSLPAAYAQLRQKMLTTPNLLVWRLVLALPAELPTFSAPAATDGDALHAITQLLETGGVIGHAALVALATLALSYYWTIERRTLRRAVLLTLPPAQRTKADEVWRDIEVRLGKYVVGEGLLGLIIGAASLAVYLLIGLPYAVTLALIAGLMELVPLVGPALGAIPAVVVAYAEEPTKVIWVILATAVIQQLENSVLVPRIMNRAVGVNPFITLLAFVSLGTLFGVPGALVAVPFAAIAQLLVNRFVLNDAGLPPEEPEGRDRFGRLRYETRQVMQDLRRQAEAQAANDGRREELADALEAIALELDALLNDGRSKREEDGT